MQESVRARCKRSRQLRSLHAMHVLSNEMQPDSLHSGLGTLAHHLSLVQVKANAFKSCL